MDFKETFSEFYSKVKTSISDGTFAKLTFAKTIGNTDLMNIYVRPIIESDVLKLELKYKFQQEEQLEIYDINSADKILLPYINSPFMSVILFTTEFDLTYKLNKKRAVSITDKAPTFGNANEILLEYLAK